MLVFPNSLEKRFSPIITYHGGGVVVEIGGLGDSARG